MLDCFPSDKKSNDVISIPLYTSKMLVRILKRERAAYKADLISFLEESIADMGRDRRI